MALLNNDEIARRLMRFRFDQRLRGKRRIPFAQLAELAGISRPTLYAAMGGKLSEKYRVSPRPPHANRLPRRGHACALRLPAPRLVPARPPLCSPPSVTPGLAISS